MNLQEIPLAGIVPYVSNSRTRSAGQIAQIADSMREFGLANPKYVDTIVRRWQKLTGKKAILEETGEEFEDNG